MNTTTVSVRRAQHLGHDPLSAVAAWRGDVAKRLKAMNEAAGDRETQMDARRRCAGLRRTDAAIRVCLAHTRGFAPAARPCAVVVHRNPWMRDRLVASLEEKGVHVVGEGDEGAVALAMVVVEQPDVLVLEDRLAWVTPVDVVQDALRFAPDTAVAVQAEDPGTAEELLHAGATVVFSRAMPPGEVAEGVVRVLTDLEQESSGRSA